jgi:rhodanese-related sulfurtransferase
MTTIYSEISPTEVSQKILAGEQFFILDVREVWELDSARITDPRIINLPMSVIGQKLNNAFPEELRNPEVEIIVMCHHGLRSGSVSSWMIQNGWKNITNLTGGIDAYAAQVDPSVGSY